MSELKIKTPRHLAGTSGHRRVTLLDEKHVHVHRGSTSEQDRDQDRRREGIRREGCFGQHLNRREASPDAQWLGKRPDIKRGCYRRRGLTYRHLRTGLSGRQGSTMSTVLLPTTPGRRGSSVADFRR